jgi:hypothetical protein
MITPTYKYVVYKIRLVKSERDIFGRPISSDELDVIAKALEDDLHQKEVFKFVHPKNGDVTYERKYMSCPVNGNTILLVGQMRRPLDMAKVRITLRSHYYKVPYIVLEHYTPAFRNPEILREMIKHAFNWVLEKYGLEVMLEPWDTVAENINWVADSEFSYDIELYKHPEMGAICMGFEEALKERMLKIEAEKAKKEKKGKKKPILKKSDNIMAYITHKNKEGIIAFLHQALRGMKTPKEFARPVRLLCDRKILKDKDVYRLPYKAFIKEIPEAKKFISEKKYNHWLNPNITNFDDDDVYIDLEKKLELIILGCRMVS